MLQTGSPVGGLSAKLNLLADCLMYSRACVKRSGVLNEAELSITCEGLEEFEKDGQKQGLNRCEWY